MGAWIEIIPASCRACPLSVAPNMGAWIEIFCSSNIYPVMINVAPNMGAWIEITETMKKIMEFSSRTQHGCVD